MSRSYVIDSSVFVKLLVAEPDRQEANAFFGAVVDQHLTVIQRELFLLEVVSVSSRVGMDASAVLDLAKQLIQEHGRIAVLTDRIWELATGMVQQGNHRAGFPSIYDALYHAIAIDTQSIFITADRRHYLKAQRFGQIQLLSQWAADHTAS